MSDIDDFAPELFGFWPGRRVYDGEGGRGWSEAETRVAVEEYFLETKSGETSEAEELRTMLNQMTAEMRDQFSAFRDLRRSAEAAAAESGDEAAGKLARADLKAAADAMSLIVRTLEKIDQLQRQFARDRELEAERAQDASAASDAKAQLLALIEARATEKAALLFAERIAEWEKARHADISVGTGPPDATDDPQARGGDSSADKEAFCRGPA